MKTLKILFVLCIMLGIALPVNSQDKGKQVVRPMKGTFYEAPGGVAAVSLITGNVTHMGNITGISVIDMSQAYWENGILWGTLRNVKNSKTKIAANGDEIYSEACATLVFNVPFDGTGSLYAEAETTGGTGRFKDCTGSVVARGTFNFITGYVMYTVEGWIKY